MNSGLLVSVLKLSTAPPFLFREIRSWRAMPTPALLLLWLSPPLRKRALRRLSGFFLPTNGGSGPTSSPSPTFFPTIRPISTPNPLSGAVREVSDTGFLSPAPYYTRSASFEQYRHSFGPLHKTIVLLHLWTASPAPIWVSQQRPSPLMSRVFED